MTDLAAAVREKDWARLVKIHADSTESPAVRAFALAMACYFEWQRLGYPERANWCGAEADVVWDRLTEEEMP
jgi:hypothetical protein